MMLMLLALPVFIGSCNKNGDDGMPQESQYSSDVLVTAFSLQANDSVLVHLDSVRFAIDFDKGMIYNADSLPKGTKIRALKVTATFGTMSNSEFHVTGGTWMKDTTFAYSKADTIDFTGDVKLVLTSEDGLFSKTYSIKVNVHNTEPDSLYWASLARRDLPVGTAIEEQKATATSDKVYTLVKTASDYLLSSSDSPEKDTWTVTKLSLPFTPVVSSFTGSTKALYVLDTAGNLYQSYDEGATWRTTGMIWTTIIGGYQDQVLGMANYDGKLMFESYPILNNGFVSGGEVPEEFPVTGFSDLVSYTNPWALAAQAMMVGGIDAQGVVHGDVWAYDGLEWGRLAKDCFPAMYGLSLCQYYMFEQNTTNWTSEKKVVWLFFGGRNASGEVDNTVYMSRTQGLIWSKGDTPLQFSSEVEPIYGANTIVWSKQLPETRSGSGVWKQLRVNPLPAWATNYRAITRVIEPVEKWDCPYIYLFGGYNAEGTLQPYLLRGVISQLTFKPVY